METGFTLPQGELNRLARQWGIGLMVGLVLLYLQDSGKLLSGLPWLLGVLAVFIFAAGWYMKSYKYVYLSAAGIRGLPTAGMKWRKISWQEPLVSKPTSLNGLKGALFTSQFSGEAVFIPSAILARPNFKACVEQYAGSRHALRLEV